MRLDDGSWTNVGTSTTYKFTSVPDGAHTVYVMAVDNAGLYSMDYIVFKVRSIGSSLASISDSVHERCVEQLIYIPQYSYEEKDDADREVLTADSSSVCKKSTVIEVEKDVSVLRIIVIVVSTGFPRFVFVLLVLYSVEDSEPPEFIVVNKSIAIINVMFLVFSPYLVKPPRF